MKEKMFGYCGMDCGSCPVYNATKNDNQAMREQTAAYFSQKFGAEVKPEQVNCTGCVPGSVNGTVLFGHCQTCAVRISAKKRGVSSCTECSDYACPALKATWANIPPEAKQNSESIRASK